MNEYIKVHDDADEDVTSGKIISINASEEWHKCLTESNNNNEDIDVQSNNANNLNNQIVNNSNINNINNNNNNNNNNSNNGNDISMDGQN